MLVGLGVDVPNAAATDTPISSLVDSPEAIANDGAHVWVVNSAYNSVSELTSNGTFVQSIAVGIAPVAVAADGTHVWVANSGSNTVTELASDGSLVQTIGLDGQPTGISSDGTDVWVTESANEEVFEIDAASGAAVSTFYEGDDPTGISSDGTNVWIANSGDGTVSQYNIADGANVNTITVGADPTGVYSDGQFVFVANTGDGTVTVLNADDGSYADGTGGSPIQVGNDPTGITANGTQAWVTNTADGTVTTLDYQPGELSVDGTFNVGNGPAAVTLNGSNAWVDNAGDGTVDDVDMTTGVVLQNFNVVDDSGIQSQTIPTGAWPSAVSSDGSDVWVTNNTDDTVSELNAQTSALLQTIPVGSDPNAVSSDGTHVWVVNAGSQSITVLNASDGSYAFGTQSAPIVDDDGPVSITSDGTHVWIVNGDGTISVLNANDGTYAFNTQTTPIVDNDGPVSISSDGTHVWIVNGDGTISVLNASDGTFALGTQTTPIVDNDGPEGISSDGVNVWIANSDGTITELRAIDGSQTALLVPGIGCASGIDSNGADVWVTSECNTNAIELDASSGAVIQNVKLEYQPVAVSVDDNGDVWIANSYVYNSWDLASGGPGSFDGANDPNDQGTLTELSAPAASVTTNDGSTQSQTFNYSPNVQTFTVPAGVTQLTLSANGAEGGRGGRDAAGRPALGGYAGVVSGTISVTPGEVLTIGVGHGGHDAPVAQDCWEGVNSIFDPSDAIGGSNPLGEFSGGNGGAAGPEGCSGYGGGGGAASVIEIGSTGSPAGVATIVAGGSGGAGGSGQYPRTLGQISLADFAARSDVVSTDGQAGISVYNACVGASSCDGGGGAAGGGGLQGGAQGLVEFGSGQSNEWFGLGGSPGENSTGAVSGLNAQYQFYDGDGANGSVAISYATGLPGIPTNVVAMPATSTTGVTWNAPSVIGSSALTDYMIRYSGNDGATWTTQDLHSTSTSATLNLSNGSNDVYEVAAVNHAGQGGWSVLANPPNPPTLTGITAGNELLSIPFTPGANGGSPITGYQYSLDGGTTWQNVNGVASPLVISGLTNGTSYTVELRALNAAGVSAASNSETGVPFTAPATPDASQFVTTSQDGQIGITWRAPNDNGSPITEYTITLYDANFAGNQVTSCDVSDLTCYDGNTSNVSSTYAISGCTLTSLTCQITGLTNYTTYWVSIQALNLAGASGRSSPRVPAVPALVSVSYSANGGVGALSSSSYEVGLPGITLPTSGVTRYGYLFAGWSTTPNDATTAVTSPYVPPSPVAPSTTAYETLYALWTPAPTYTVTYDGNGDTGGSVPVDPQSPYYAETDATVLANTGALVDAGFVFNGWNTEANGQGASYSAGQQLDVTADTVLFAQWSSAAQYTVTYDGNGNTGGVAPSDPLSPYFAETDATVLANTGSLTDTDYVFSGWNTEANGQGTSYVAGQSLDVTANTVLYAQWTLALPAPPLTPPPTPPTKTTLAPPGVPTQPKANVTAGLATISWSAPTTDGGSPVTGYTVTSASGAVVCTTTGSLSCVVSGLVGKGPFVFSVTAVNAVGTGPKAAVTAHLTALACGTVGAPKCATHSRTVVFGVVYFATDKYSISAKSSSHATLTAVAREIIADHVRTLTVVGATDDRGSASKNLILSMRRARATVAALRVILRGMHVAPPRFSIKADGISKKYAGLPKNRRATIIGAIRV
jgi:YVTN family beta-propeller protein